MIVPLPPGEADVEAVTVWPPELEFAESAAVGGCPLKLASNPNTYNLVVAATDTVPFEIVGTEKSCPEDIWSGAAL